MKSPKALLAVIASVLLITACSSNNSKENKDRSAHSKGVMISELRRFKKALRSKFAVEGFSESLAYELSAINVQVKIVEPGGVQTNFGPSLEFIANTIPEYEELRSGFMGRYAKPTAHLQRATADDVAETIYRAATDGKQQLRYIIGADAQFYIDGKMNNSDEDYIRLMRDYFINE
jgi:NAD(P)-dependent dehydrogenase (short-subunit alcohol dehydrogenase family)